MKTKLTILTGILVLLGIALLPAATAQAATGTDDAIQNVAENPVQVRCNGEPKGDQCGPRDGSKGENAPRDGRGARRGERRGEGRGEGQGQRDGSGQGRGQARGGGARNAR